ncbi:alpha/beta fold hydrolase [Paenibacillus sp. MBLB4367]|uniref:alpha/beta fold hydrolase n=1 Tax=Paenibacillus sp. MBLB4367 TaxID=3384767 RepID=UPI003908049B
MTGATGYIGKHVLKRLADEIGEVLVLVRSPDKVNRLISRLGEAERKRVKPIKGDLTMPGLGIGDEDMLRVLNANVIVHAGGPMNITLDDQTAHRTFLEAAREIAAIAERIHAGNGLSHFVHVVGYMSPFHEQNVDLTADPFDMDGNWKDEGGYERMKFKADLVIRQHALRHGYPLSVVNPSTVIGSERTGVTEQTGGFGLLVDAMRRGMMPAVPGGGDHWLPLVGIEETAAFIAALAKEPKPVNETYMLLEGREESPAIKETVGIIARELRLRKPSVSVPLPVLRKTLKSGFDKLTGIPAESLSFITRKTFDIASKERGWQAYGLRKTDIRKVLPSVVADLDYRLSHPEAAEPASFAWDRLANVAALTRAGAGTPILFLHGVMGRADQWTRLASLLPNRPIALLDLPGCGRSPYHHAEDPLEGHVQAILDALEQAGQPVDLVGHSFGAVVAARVAAKAPDRVRKLLLLQPAFVRRRIIGWPKKLILRSRFLLDLYMRRGLTVSSLEEMLLRNGTFRNASELPKDYIASIIRDLKSPRVRRTNGEILSILHHGPGGMPPNALEKGQISIIWGNADKEYAMPAAPEHIERIELPYGHQFPLSHPEETAALVQSLLDL